MTHLIRPAASVLLALLFGAVSVGAPASFPLEAAVSTDPVRSDADDPALWRHPTDASLSLVLGTDKGDTDGALCVFDLQGRLRQEIRGLLRPNNVDLESGVSLGGRRVDLAVLTERGAGRLRAFTVDPQSRRLTELPSDLTLFAGETGRRAQPMGIALYRRADDALFAFVSRKAAVPGAVVGQYRLQLEDGRLRARRVRTFGRVAGPPSETEVESLAVDDALGYVYYSEERYGIHKYAADPAARPTTELAFFGRDGFSGDREGIAVYSTGAQEGYLLCTDQLPGQSRYLLYSRQGEPGRPHDHQRTLGVLTGGGDETDGIEAASAAFGPRFRAGLLVAMNSRGRNFQLFPWPVPRRR